MKSYWIRVSSKSNDWCSYKRGEDTQIHMEEPRDDGGRDWSNAALSQRFQGLPATPDTRRVIGQMLPPKGPTLQIPWFLLSGLQNWEGINFCCFKSPGLWRPKDTHTHITQILGRTHATPWTTCCQPCSCTWSILVGKFYGWAHPALPEPTLHSQRPELDSGSWPWLPRPPQNTLCNTWSCLGTLWLQEHADLPLLSTRSLYFYFQSYPRKQGSLLPHRQDLNPGLCLLALCPHL